MQKSHCDTFDFDDDNSNSWIITSLMESVPIIINSALNEDEKRVFHLIFYENLSQRKCASVLGKSRSSINRTYYKAIKK
jgi:DNA-directed RNA polymerase specialized sigma subunit